MISFFRKRHVFFSGFNKACTLLFFSTSFVFFIVHTALSSVTVQTVWGEYCIDQQPVLEKLINSSLLKRLQYIDQSGPLTYFGYIPKFSRYEHSIGVLVLLQKAGAPLKEQIAGLLHDTSHTTFSHIGDHLFYKNDMEKSYQDIIHVKYLKAMDVQSVTGSYGVNVEELDPDLPIYKALEQSLPELCADRIQYIVHTGVLLNKISQKQAKEIINNLQFKDNTWFFTKKEYAKSIAMLSLLFTKEFWGAPENLAFYEYFTEILKRALDLKIISKVGIQCGTDQAILDLLEASKDPYIQKGLKDLKITHNFQKGLEKLKDMHRLFKEVDFGEGDFNMKPKFRGVDPFVQVGSKFERLSSIDPEFKRKFEDIKAWCNKGYGLKMMIKEPCNVSLN